MIDTRKIARELAEALVTQSMRVRPMTVPDLHKAADDHRYLAATYEGRDFEMVATHQQVAAAYERRASMIGGI